MATDRLTPGTFSAGLKEPEKKQLCLKRQNHVPNLHHFLFEIFVFRGVKMEMKMYGGNSFN